MILTIEINTTKDDPMLVDKALGRIYTIDGVEDVRLLDTGIEELEQENRLLRARNERLEGGWQGLTEQDKARIRTRAKYHWEMTAHEYACKIQEMTIEELRQKNQGGNS